MLGCGAEQGRVEEGRVAAAVELRAGAVQQLRLTNSFCQLELLAWK